MGCEESRKMAEENRRIVKLSGKAALSNHAKDAFVSPHLSELTKVGAPDLRDKAKGWVNNFILTSVLKLGKDYPYRLIIFHTLRKIEGAFKEYQAGRESLGRFMVKRREISSYFHALRQFEIAALLTYHAYETIGTLISEKVFEKGEGSSVERLNRIQNIAKHVHENLIETQFPKDCTVPIWLTNTGIECYDQTFLAFSEFAELLADLTEVADQITDPSPRKGKV